MTVRDLTLLGRSVSYRPRSIVLLSSLAALLAVCASVLFPFLANDRRNGVPQISVKICYYFVVGQLVAAAEAEGHFAKAGLTVMLLPFASGRDALDALLEGKCDIATLANTPIVALPSGKLEFRIIATAGTDRNFGKILAHKDRGIETVKDVWGRQIGVVSRTTSQFFLHQILISNSLAPNSIKEIPFATPAEASAAFLRGEVDAVSLWEPFAGRLLQAPTGDIIEFASPGLIIVPSNLAARASFVADRQHDLRIFLRALYSAEAGARRSAEKAADAIAIRLGLERNDILVGWAGDRKTGLSLSQSLLIELDDERRWAVSQGMADAQDQPNYLDLISADALAAVAPERVTIYR